MLMTYSKPMLLDSGNSSEIIKGQCGWGKELPFFDETGAVKGSYRRRKYRTEPCYGSGVVNICYVCKTETVSCSAEKDDC
ncbi:hypothetical protein U1P98_07435 [Lysinibacillus irui]|uniref:Uncharacterized protein n=1 Tax=Lysinibacillus irui TaxID=2998077 RepID=A0ABU5NJB3_9BACI|nr:hypothetical protein [Lysinibacillus irui]MEA0553747.1 hypothetical protein [Lysinibacillus irui]MEA0976131.1 hypothetical protein [Lysinibacillus irui]MEA1042285.1 hypothetical protein [Lysinibacillus irui]